MSSLNFFDLPKASTDSSTTATPTATHIEALVRSFYEAVNNRDFSASSPTWARMSPGFIAETEFSSWPKKINLSDMLGHFKEYTKRRPEYRLEATDVTVSVNEKTGHATVFANVDQSGIPLGVIRPTMGSFDFVRLNGQWYCIRYRAMPGWNGCPTFTVSQQKDPVQRR